MRFTWDPTKAATNHAKHGVSFAEAEAAFDDPLAIEMPDDRRDYGEERWMLIGISAGRLLLVTVCFTEDEERGVIRIISARPATATERRLYLEL